MSEPAEPVLILVRDLMFASRIRATAQELGVQVQMLRDPQKLEQTGGKRLIVDLNQPASLDAAIAWRNRTAGDVVGFVAHVDTDTIEAAKAGGIERVLPRSRFVQALPDLLRG